MLCRALDVFQTQRSACSLFTVTAGTWTVYMDSTGLAYMLSRSMLESMQSEQQVLTG